MKKRFAYMMAMVLSAVIFLASCRRDEAEVIPRDELARIYAEMLLTDQWIVHTPNIRLIADTSLVYSPIFEKYGYDADDYRKSIDHYMDDPERFARIFREAGEILDARLSELEKRKEDILRMEKLRLEAEKYRPDIKWEEIYRDRQDSAYVRFSDSLVFKLDSTGVISLEYAERGDTVYDGVMIVMHEPDTVAAEQLEILPLSKKYKKDLGIVNRKLKIADEFK